MHLGLIAAKGSVREFRAAFEKTWPELEIAATERQFADSEALHEWLRRNEEFVSAADWTKDRPGKSTYAFWQDGDWVVFWDASYTLAGDQEKLGLLSGLLGTVASFIVETAGGCALFWCYQDGRLRRSISHTNGHVTCEGEPLVEEAGIDISRFYMDETEALLKAFGLTPLEEIPLVNDCLAVVVIDRTDYSSFLAGLSRKVPQPSEQQPSAHPTPAAPKKPWWQFW